MEWEFSGEIWHWRGPAPFFFVSVPPDVAADLLAASPMVSYGWGVIPVTVVIGATRFTTSIFPKDGGYVVGIKVAVRKAEGLEEGDAVAMRLSIST